MKALWEIDEAQFPRLLSEIKAVGLTPEQMDDLSVSMDLSKEGIHELLDRAEEAFEVMKAKHHGWPPRPKKFSVPVVYTTTGWVLIEAPDMASAKAKATVMNERDGVEYLDIKDAECEVECMVDEIEEVKP
jgi:hypothetical protein